MSPVDGQDLDFTRGASLEQIETGDVFQPRLTGDGLLPAIITSAADGAVLMFAWMNANALEATLKTRTVHFWSRSRSKIWQKGEESGNTLTVERISTDCDQDVIWIEVTVNGAGVACHTGARSCFYREIDLGSVAGGPVALKPRR